MIFVNHGEDTVCTKFAECLSREYGFNAEAPYSGTSYDLLTGKPIEITFGVRVKKNVRKPSDYDLLVDAAKRLLERVRGSKNMRNSEMHRYTNEMNRLSEKMGGSMTNK